MSGPLGQLLGCARNRHQSGPPSAPGPRRRLCARRRWLNDFWFCLAQANLGVRIQAHTHPGEAFHLPTDDAFPIIHTIGFLSLVIPNFALGPIGFENAYLAEIQEDGCWREVAIAKRIILR